jgi:IS5 family transposase
MMMAHDKIDKLGRAGPSNPMQSGDAANVADSRVLPDLLHGRETRVWGDQAYRGQRATIRERAPKARDFTNRRYCHSGGANESERAKNRTKSKVRAKVEHPIENRRKDMQRRSRESRGPRLTPLKILARRRELGQLRQIPRDLSCARRQSKQASRDWPPGEMLATASGGSHGYWPNLLADPAPN